MASPAVPVFSPHTSGYFITVDGEVVEDAGKNGVIHGGREVALRIKQGLQKQNPQKEVLLFGAHKISQKNLPS